MASNVSKNADRFLGFADNYDSYRPTPPTAIIDILKQLAKVQRPKLVVDLGCGTGLSTRIWAHCSDEVLGIEPSDDMLKQAREHTAFLADCNNVKYQKGFSTKIDLPDESVDVVTCSQCLHWMDPKPTFAEVSRVLRPGGVFAAYDHGLPPIILPEIDAAYRAFMQQVKILIKKYRILPPRKSWHKGKHLGRIKKSGQFGFVREIAVNHTEVGDSERLINLVLSLSSVMAVIKHGLSEEEIGLDKLRDVARDSIGDNPVKWFYEYRIRLGIK